MSQTQRSRSIRLARWCTLAVTTAMLGCTPDWATENQSDVLLRIVDVVGDPGAEGGSFQESDFLLSDVAPVVNDNAVLTIESIAKNQLISNGLGTTGVVNDVICRRYTVRYVRADGRNTEGVDVPYSFSGDMNVRIQPGTDSEVAIIVVRHTAKIEPPLRNMVFIGNNIGRSGGANIMVAIAQITIYGETTTRKAVTASASLEVHFADYAN